MTNTRYLVSLECAPAKDLFPLATSGFMVLWNNVVIIDDSPPSDHLIHLYKAVVKTTLTSNTISL